MDVHNPAINPPRLSSPTKRGYESRSPSRSPTRKYHSARDLDPLLRGLSPTATLRAFSSQSDESAGDHLSRSVENTTHAQRELGIKAAQSCLDLRSWARELDAWDWPGRFDEPEPVRKKQRTSAMSHGSLTSSSQREDGVEEEYCGSLPAQTVRAYQSRLDEIHDDLDDVDVEELKEFVLGAHRQAGYGEASVDDSIGAIVADTNLKHLDDFTSLVTATILQCLPYLSRLHYLVRTWTIRLDVLRQTPSYLRDLEQARTDLDHGWAALAVSNHPAATDALQRVNATFSRGTMLEMKEVVQKQVNSLGRRLDGLLDVLEGRQECVPEPWIEDFEELEEQYGAWVVQAERKVFEGEWKSLAPEANGAAVQPGATRELNGAGIASNGRINELPTETSTTVTVGPTITSSAMIAAGHGTTMDTSTHTTTSGPQSTTVTTVTPLPPGRAETHTSTFVEGTTVTSNRSSSIPRTSSTNSSPRKSRSRHVPIVLDSYSDEFSRSISKDRPAPGQGIPAVPHVPFSRSENDRQIFELDVKKRAAFLNGDIEKSESLNRSKPAPIVRPFEHASNAFTRLFKRDKEDDKESARSRNSSAGSRRSLGRKSSRSKMVYADLMAPPMAKDDDISTLRRDSNPRSPKKVDPRVLEYVDMIRVPQRSSSERPRSKASKEVTATTPEYWNRAKSSSKRSSRQDITALPSGGFHDPPSIPAVITEREGPETYLPTGLSSPFHSPVEPEPGFDIPENWPLSGEVTPAVEGENPMEGDTTNIRDLGDDAAIPAVESVDGAPATDAFEDMFVSGMPSSSRRRAASGINAANELETRFGDYESSFVPTTTSDVDDVYYTERPPADRSMLRTGRSSENLILEDPPAPKLPRPVSMVVEADEDEMGRNIDNVSWNREREGEEEVGNGSNAAAYFGSAGRETSSATPSSSKRVLAAAMQRSHSTPPVSPMVLRLRIPTSSSPADSDVSDPEELDPSDLIRRASTASIETFPRSKLRSVHVKRQSVAGSISSQPQTPQEPLSPSADKDAPETFTPTSPLHYKGAVYFPSPPSALPSPPSVPPRGSSLRSSMDARRSQESQRAVDPDDLSTAMASGKRKNQIRPEDRPTSARSGKAKISLEPAEDNFDRYVSEALDSVHASNIKFRTRPGAVTPLPQPRAGGRLPKAAEQSSKNMTLAPAGTSPRKSTPNDPEVKLYHLLQAGRSEPIKLYVRLVGEGERVMVRVGGGWADLADYLRQYAEHHGSRTVSENVELQTVSATPTLTSANGFGKRTFSGPAVFDAMSNARGSASSTPFPPLERPKTNESQREWLNQDQPRFTMGESDESASPSPVVSRRRENSFGLQRSIGANSRPSTAHSITQPGMSSTLRQGDSAESSPAGSLSMAGPGSSNKPKAGLPESKARWVEGMIERVNKSASAEKNRGERDKLFTDIGKAGQTRRLMLRKSSGAGG